jgi:hypothetical protein
LLPLLPELVQERQLAADLWACLLGRVGGRRLALCGSASPTGVGLLPPPRSSLGRLQLIHRTEQQRLPIDTQERTTWVAAGD